MKLYFDFESLPIEPLPEYPPKPIGLALYLEGLAPYYLAWGHAEGNNSTEAEARRIFTEYYNDPNIELVAHNSPFDTLVAHVHWELPLEREALCHDTMVMAFLCEPHAINYQLKPMAKRLLGMEPEEKDEVADWLKAKGYMKKNAKEIGELIWLAPGELVGKYAVGDVVRTRALFEHYVVKLEASDMWTAYRREMTLQTIMLQSTLDGIRVDVDRLREDVAMYDKALAKIDALLFQMLGCEPFNIDSDVQLADAIDKAHPGLEWSYTKTGKRSTSKVNMEKTLKGLTGKLLAVMQYRASIHTCVNTFMRPWLIQATHAKGGGRIRCQWNTTRSDEGGARTGRLSSSPNFMNIPTLASNKFAAVLKLWDEWLREDGYPALPNVRSYILADEGEVLISYDFASQELRVLAHYEDGVLLKAYKEDPTQDLHQFAANMISERLHIAFTRKHAKTCIAKGSMVLTESGLVKIEDITSLHRVWDGVEYVQHTGVINQGVKKVLTYQGLTATYDHEVYTNEHGRLELLDAAQLRASIVKTGKGGVAIRVLEDSVASSVEKSWEKGWESAYALAGTVSNLWSSTVDAFRQLNSWLLNSVPLLQYNEVPSLLSARPEVLGYTATMRKPKISFLQKLRGAWDSLQVRDMRKLRSVHRDRVPNVQLRRLTHRPHRQRWPLRTWKFACSNRAYKCWQQVNKCLHGLQRTAGAPGAYVASIKNRLSGYATRAWAYYKKISCWTSVGRGGEVKFETRWSEVYDITNAGPRNRFTVSDCLVSNCAFAILYGSGLATLAENLGSTKDEAGNVKGAYLEVLPGVKDLMDNLKRRARNNQPIKTWGGRLYYVEPPRFNKDENRWMTFDYKLLNYLVQGSSADITKEAIIAYAKRRVHGKFLLTVHDQIVISVPMAHFRTEAAILQDCMESIQLDAPLLADGSYGPNLHNMKDFDAKNKSEFLYAA